MDTGTHLVVGLGLAGLSQLDPVIATNHTVMIAVLITTVIGSQIPDIDSLLRIKSNAAYIRNHRGMSHSIPAIFFWTWILTMFVTFIFPEVPLEKIAMWAGLSVFIHVFTDLFNTYGTQALRPFSQKWISWNMIHIFDPFIFFSHLVAISIWAIGLLAPTTIFPVLYVLIAIYMLWRVEEHIRIENGLPLQDESFQNGDRYFLVTTVNWNIWHVVKTRKDGSYVLGEIKNDQLTWLDEVYCEQHPSIEASKFHEDVKAMLYFTPYACASVKTHAWGYEVRWADIRYRHRKQYPFVAVVLMNHEYEFLDSYAGWLSESKLEKRLGLN